MIDRPFFSSGDLPLAPEVPFGCEVPRSSSSAAASFSIRFFSGPLVRDAGIAASLASISFSSCSRNAEVSARTPSPRSPFPRLSPFGTEPRSAGRSDANRSSSAKLGWSKHPAETWQYAPRPAFTPGPQSTCGAPADSPPTNLSRIDCSARPRHTTQLLIGSAFTACPS